MCFDPEKNFEETAKGAGGGRANIPDGDLSGIAGNGHPDVIDENDIGQENMNSIPDDDAVGLG